MAIFFLSADIALAQQPQPQTEQLKSTPAPPPAGMPKDNAPAEIPAGSPGSGNIQPAPKGQGSPMPIGSQPQQGQAEKVPPPPGPGVPDNQTTTETTSSGGNQIFQIVFLLIAVGMAAGLAYFYFFSYRLSLRIQRLEALMEKLTPSPVATNEPSLFSWQDALKGFEKGWILFSPETKVNTPGIVGIACNKPELSLSLSANIIYNTVNEMNQSVIFLSKSRGEDEIGKALLAIESGRNIDSLDNAARDEVVGRFSLEMTKYESGLFIFRDYNIKPEDLYEQVAGIAAGYETGCIIIEKADVLEKVDMSILLRQLRLLSVRTHIPVILIDDFSGKDLIKMDESETDEFIALLSVEELEKDNSIQIKYRKYPGTQPSEKMPVNKETWKIG